MDGLKAVPFNNTTWFSSPWVSRRVMGTRLKPCPSLQVGFPRSHTYRHHPFQIVDTPEWSETVLNTALTAIHKQTNRTLVACRSEFVTTNATRLPSLITRTMRVLVFLLPFRSAPHSGTGRAALSMRWPRLLGVEPCHPGSCNVERGQAALDQEVATNPTT